MLRMFFAGFAGTLIHVKLNRRPKLLQSSSKVPERSTFISDSFRRTGLSNHAPLEYINIADIAAITLN